MPMASSACRWPGSWGRKAACSASTCSSECLTCCSAARVARNGIANVRVLHTTAEDALFRCLASGSLSAVYVLFPDPWPKKRHHKRRFLRAENVARLAEEKPDSVGLSYLTLDRSAQSLSGGSAQPGGAEAHHRVATRQSVAARQAPANLDLAVEGDPRSGIDQRAGDGERVEPGRQRLGLADCEPGRGGQREKHEGREDATPAHQRDDAHPDHAIALGAAVVGAAAYGGSNVALTDILAKSIRMAWSRAY